MGSLGQTHTYRCIYNKEGPTVLHRDLCSIFGDKLNGKEFENKIDTCICIIESVCCMPALTLLLNYTQKLKILKFKLKIDLISRKEQGFIVCQMELYSIFYS